MEKSYFINGYDEWQFIEDFLPNYHQRNDVLYNDIVSRYVNGEELDEYDLAIMKADFPNIETAEKWLDNDVKRLFLEAVEACYFTNKINKIVVLI